MSKKCSQCAKWQYNESIERRYGMGTGLCEEDKEPKGCDRTGCLMFQKSIKEILETGCDILFREVMLQKKQ